MRLSRYLLVAFALMSAGAAPAYADATVFVGTATTPANRAVKGLAFGLGLLIVGFEIEVADAGENVADAAPSLRTGMGNVLLQTPIPIAGFRFYVTTGAGGFRERLGTRQETNIGLNTGGGVKMTLIGPLRVRLDYRVFNLRGDPLYSTVHRVYAGANLSF